jgi:hypothetical protein
MDVCNEAREIISASNRERLEDLGKLLRLCESPVEQILIAALFARWNPEVNLRFKRLQCHLSANYPAWDGVFTVCVEPQRTVTTLMDDKYRTDIYIYITRFRRIEESDTNSRWPELARLVVEVDGHDYHERTKEQASYDKKRDRDLALEACRVIRFTGSDVFRNPEQCAEDIDFQINDLASLVLRDFGDRGKLEELITG